jgi:hypothetical protein
LIISALENEHREQRTTGAANRLFAQVFAAAACQQLRGHKASLGQFPMGEPFATGIVSGAPFCPIPHPTVVVSAHVCNTTLLEMRHAMAIQPFARTQRDL